MSKFRFLFFSIVMMHFQPVAATEIQRVNEGIEIVVNVPVLAGSEKKVLFEEPVALGVTASFKDAFRIQSFGNSVYFQAKKATEKSFRIMAKGQHTQRTYILNIAVSAKASPETINVLWESASDSELRQKQSKLQSSKITAVELVRFVSQSLFAPKFAIEPLPGARLVPLGLPENMDFIYEGSPLSIKPLLAYKAGQWTVTAFEAVNKSRTDVVEIDVMKIYSRVNAYGALAQHEYVGTSMDDNKTVIYVVTQGDFVHQLNVGV